MNIEVININGDRTGKTVELSENIFNIEPNDHVIYLAVKLYLANQRQGTHKTKERGEVQGSNKKPWRQKGTGNARAGHKRSPLWRHGGTIFGPRPRSYGFKLNKKVKKLARKSALSYKVKEQKLMVLESPNFKSPSTKLFVKSLEKINQVDQKVLFVSGSMDKNFYLSGKNVPKIKFSYANQLNTYDILNADQLVLIDDSIEIIHKQFN